MSQVPHDLPRPATYDDLCALPEHLVGEIVDGELYASPRPASPHARASSVLGGELFPAFDRGRGGPGGWVILFEPELHFGKNVLVPDLAGWRRGRMPVVPNVPYFTLAPDWICEVVSPKTSRLDRVKKLPVYAKAEVAWAWMIDPIYRSLEVFRLDDGFWVLDAVFGGDDLVRAKPFDAIELDLKAPWLEEPPSKVSEGAEPGEAGT